MNARVSGYLTQLQAVCGTPSVSGDAVIIGPGTTLAFRGLNPGSDASAICPANHAVRGFGGRAGLLVDQLVFSCVSWRVESVEGGFSLVENTPVSSPTVGGSGGTAFSEIACPSGQVAVGANIRAGDGIDAFGISCATPSLAID